MPIRSTTMNTRSTAPALALVATLGLALSSTLAGCQGHSDDSGASPEASTRPVPDKGPKRPADISPPPPPVPGQTAR